MHDSSLADYCYNSSAGADPFPTELECNGGNAVEYYGALLAFARYWNQTWDHESAMVLRDNIFGDHFFRISHPPFHLTHAMGCALVGAHSHWMLSGTCNPMSGCHGWLIWVLTEQYSCDTPPPPPRARAVRLALLAIRWGLLWVVAMGGC